MNTWTSALILILHSTLIHCAPLKPQNETMYQVIVKKCPQLNQTELQTNLNETFTNQCVNWTEIQTARTPNLERCLLLYESMTHFCSNLDQKNYSGLVPTNKAVDMLDVTAICMSNGSIAHQLSNKTEHNMSRILAPANCVLTCGNLVQNVPVTHEICQYAYYFASFEVEKLVEEANKLHKSTDQMVKESATAPKVKEVEGNSTAAQKPSATELQKFPTVPEKTTKKPLPDIANIEPVVPAENSPVKPKLDTVVPDQTPIKTVVPGNEPIGNVNGEVGNQMPIPNSNNDEFGYKNNNRPDLNPNQDDGLAQDDGFAQQDEEQDNAAKEDKIVFVEGPEEGKKVKPNTVEEESVNPYSPEDDMEGDSNFFAYFSVLMVLCVVGYVGYHNRQKILALLLEGKRSKKNTRARRPNSANYHKLDSNLEEAMSSSCTKNASNVIY